MQQQYRDVVPSMYERTPEGVKSWDPFSKLFESRIIMIVAPINAATASAVITQLLVLNQIDPDEEINIYMNSPGGDYESAIAIYDTMKFISNPIVTTCIGEAKGVATIVLAGGDRRAALPNARITLYTIEEAGERGQATDIALRAQLMEQKFNIFKTILAEETGQDVEKIERDLSRHTHLVGQKAVDYGIIDMITPAGKKTRYSSK